MPMHASGGKWLTCYQQSDVFSFSGDNPHIGRPCLSAGELLQQCPGRHCRHGPAVWKWEEEESSKLALTSLSDHLELQAMTR